MSSQGAAFNKGDYLAPMAELRNDTRSFDHSKEDNNNLLRVCNTFNINKYTFLLLITTGTLTVLPSLYINSTGAQQVSNCDGMLCNIYSPFFNLYAQGR